MRRSLLAILALLLPLCACASLNAPPPGYIGLWPEAAGATEDAELIGILKDDWELRLRARPVWATQLGDPRLNGLLPDNSINGIERRRDEIWQLQRRLGAVSVDALGLEDQLTAEALDSTLRRELRTIEARLNQWQVDPLAGHHIEFLRLSEFQPTGTPLEREQLLQRWGAIPEFMRRDAEALQRGLAAGKVAAGASVKKAIAQLDRILDTPTLLSPLMEASLGGGRLIELPVERTLSSVAAEYLGDARLQERLRLANPHLMDTTTRALGTYVLLPADDDPLSASERGEFLAATLRLVQDEIYPAFAGYRTVLAERLLPKARSDDRVGLVWLPGGEELYERQIERHVGIGRSARELHGIGVDAVAEVNAEMLALGAELFGVQNFLQLRVRLADDPALHFDSAEAIVSTAEASLARAEAAVGAVFRTLPAADCVVLPVPAAEAPESTTAFYGPPSAEAGRPGRYYVNTYEPASRPRYEAEALAFHEAVPGHHTQIALAQELERLPLFRRHLGSTAFVEGWALYAEKLADELGLYSGPLDRLGMLSYDAWRSARLVVDTGLHADGWSRAQAIRYMQDHTLLSPENIENEVDRYIAWPGQALAYKVGELRILELRQVARQVLGPEFSLAAFHDEVLRHGAVELSILRDRITRWMGSGGR